MAEDEVVFVIRMTPLKLHIGQVKTNSGIFYGNNTQLNWRHISKKSDGFGAVDGNQSRVQENMTELVDADFLDAPYDSNQQTGER